MSYTNPLNVSIIRIAAILGAAAAAVNAVSTPVRTDGRGIGSERFSAGKRAILSVARPEGVGASSVVGTVAVWGADLGNPLNGSPLGNAFAASVTPTMSILAGDGATLVFQTDIPYAAFSNNNWIVETESFKLTGTFAIDTAGVITGTGSNLDPEVDVGDKVIIGGRVFEIATRTSDTAGTVTAATAGTAVVAGAVGYNVSQSKKIKTYAATETGPQQFDVTDVGGFARIEFAVAPPAPGPTPVIAGAQNSNIAIYKVTPVQILAAGAHAPLVRTGIRSRTVLWANSVVATGAISAATIDLEVSTAS